MGRHKLPMELKKKPVIFRCNRKIYNAMKAELQVEVQPMTNFIEHSIIKELVIRKKGRLSGTA